MRFQYNTVLKANARNLRKNQTDVERLLWSLLRSRQLVGLKFRRQFPVGRYILDFYCPEIRLAIELDGGQHNVVKHYAADVERDKALSNLNITVFRFWNNEVLQHLDAIAEKIIQFAKR